MRRAAADPADRGRRRPGLSWSLLRLGWAGEGRAVGVLSVWAGWERLLAWRQDIRALRKGGLLRYAITRHAGPPVRLRDGGWVAEGGRIVELHLDNRRFAELSASGRGPLHLVRVIREDLRGLATLVEEGALGPIAAVHGLSLMAPAAPILGFETRELPHTVRLRLERFFFAGLVLLYNPQGWRSVERQAARWPGEVWMSAGDLRRRYAAPSIARA